MTKRTSYKVGYGRPPAEHQFAKGQSGNRAGRPRGSKSISAVIAAGLSERVTVTINGKRRSITKLEAAMTQLANKAAAGDRHAAKLIIDLLHQAEHRDEARADPSLLGADERRARDAAILAAFRDSARTALPEDSDDGVL